MEVIWDKRTVSILTMMIILMRQRIMMMMTMIMIMMMPMVQIMMMRMIEEVAIKSVINGGYLGGLAGARPTLPNGFITA